MFNFLQASTLPLRGAIVHEPEMMLGFDPEHNERELANAWFQTVLAEDPGDARRIATLLLQMLADKEPGAARTWRDHSGGGDDGGLPVPIALGATNGL